MFKNKKIIAMSLFLALFLVTCAPSAFATTLNHDVPLSYDSYGDVYYGSSSYSDTHMNFNFQPTNLDDGDYARSYIRIVNDDSTGRVYHYTTTIDPNYMTFVNTYRANNYDVYVTSCTITYESGNESQYSWYFGNPLQQDYVEEDEGASAYFSFQWQTSPVFYNWKLNNHTSSTLQFLAGYRDPVQNIIFPEFICDDNLYINN